MIRISLNQQLKIVLGRCSHRLVGEVRRSSQSDPVGEEQLGMQVVAEPDTQSLVIACQLDDFGVGNAGGYLRDGPAGYAVDALDCCGYRRECALEDIKLNERSDELNMLGGPDEERLHLS